MKFFTFKFNTAKNFAMFLTQFFQNIILKIKISTEKLVLFWTKFFQNWTPSIFWHF